MKASPCNHDLLHSDNLDWSPNSLSARTKLKRSGSAPGLLSCIATVLWRMQPMFSASTRRFISKHNTGESHVAVITGPPKNKLQAVQGACYAAHATHAFLDLTPPSELHTAIVQAIKQLRMTHVRLSVSQGKRYSAVRKRWKLEGRYTEHTVCGIAADPVIRSQVDQLRASAGDGRHVLIVGSIEHLFMLGPQAGLAVMDLFEYLGSVMPELRIAVLARDIFARYLGAIRVVRMREDKYGSDGSGICCRKRELKSQPPWALDAPSACLHQLARLVKQKKRQQRQQVQLLIKQQQQQRRQQQEEKEQDTEQTIAALHITRELEHAMVKSYFQYTLWQDPHRNDNLPREVYWPQERASQRHHSTLTAFLEKYDPKTLDTEDEWDDILDRFHGREHVLFAALDRKYGLIPGTASGLPVYKHGVHKKVRAKPLMEGPPRTAAVGLVHRRIAATLPTIKEHRVLESAAAVKMHVRRRGSSECTETKQQQEQHQQHRQQLQQLQQYRSQRPHRWKHLQADQERVHARFVEIHSQMKAARDHDLETRANALALDGRRRQMEGKRERFTRTIEMLV